MASSNATYARAYFEKLGYPPDIASAIVGNLMQESYADLRTGVSGDPGVPGGSWGIAQWNKGRLANLKQFAADRGKSWTDFDTQLAFVDHELKGPYAHALAAMQSGNLADKTLAFRKFYEVADPAADKRRIANASSLMGLSAPQLASASPTPTSAIVPTASQPEPVQSKLLSAIKAQLPGSPPINQLVQLATRRGEDVQGLPGLGPSRGMAVDRAMTPQPQVQPTADTGVSASPDPNYPFNTPSMQGRPAPAPSGLMAQLQPIDVLKRIFGGYFT